MSAEDPKNDTTIEENNQNEANMPVVSPGSTVLYADPGTEDPDADKRSVAVKKLPALLRKSYSKRRLNARILKKLYVPEDRETMRALFVQGANPKKPALYAIPRDALFTKRELKTYKKMVSEIKRQKGRVRLLPLAAVFISILLAVSFVTAFKNPLVKRGIRSVCEYFFQAKCDIGSVNVKLLSASLTVKNLAIGNKNAVMKNLFEAEKIELDFSMIQALRGKFDAQNIEISGMAFNTDRTTSCEIPYKPRFFDEDSEFRQELKTRSNTAIEDLKAQAAELLGGSDVESIVENITSRIQTPEAAQKALSDGEELFEKWKAKPEELKIQIDDFAESVKVVQTFNVQAFNVKSPEDIETLRTELEKINQVIEASKTLKTQADAVVAEVKDDATTLEHIASNVSESAKADIAFARERLTTITGALSNSKALFTNALDTVAYDMLGKYYTYLQRAVSLAAQIKEKSGEVEELQSKLPKKEKKEKKEKKAKRERLEGTTFWYTTEYPSVLVERVFASGPGFSAELSELTNNQNMRNIPTRATGSLSLYGIQHSAGITVDARQKSTAPLLALNYTGSGFTANFDGTRIATKSGVPSLDGTAVLSLGCTADKSGFSMQGAVSLDPLTLTSDGFSNELVTKYYKQALSSVTNMSFGYDLGYIKGSGLYMDLSGNYADQFVNALKSVVMSIGRDAKDAAFARIEAELNATSNEVVLKAKEFLGIEGDIDLQNMRLSDLESLLENKKIEIENRIKEEVNKATEEAKEKATEAVTATMQKAEEQATETIKNAVKDALGTNEEDASNAADAIKNAAGGFLRNLGQRQ